jgi:hypothetical protein
MGCDIHVHVEYKKEVFDEEQWWCGDFFSINPYYHTDPYERQYNLIGLCDDRCYSRFAVLANVRNYGNTEYIDEPRGLPDDVSTEVMEDNLRWGVDGHSHSYFTLKELIDYQKNIKPLKHRGMICPDSQKALDEYGILPEEWCQWTNQAGWAFREWEEENTVLIPLIEALKKRADELYFIYDFLWERDPQNAYELSDKIRIVFWFDN